MKSYWLMALLALQLTRCDAQRDSAMLLKEVQMVFSMGIAAVSDVLTNQKYLSLHPTTEFRELIKANSTSDILKITPGNEPGKKIRVWVKVVDKNNQPVVGVQVYLYQTDSRGWYAADAPHVLSNEGDMRHARLFGYAKTDINGRIELHTVKPSGYPKSDLPAHIHIHLDKTGYQTQVTELLFSDDERLVGKIKEQALQNRFVVAEPEKTTGFDQQFAYTLTLPQ